MPKQVSQAEYDALLEIISRFPDSALTDEIVEAMPDGLSRRTLLRRLNTLLEEGRLVRVGKGRATRYRVRVESKIKTVLPMISTKLQGERYVPVNEEGAEIRHLVRRPRENRQPVGYNRHFLDSYRPNET